MVLLMSRQAVQKILHLPCDGLRHITRNRRQVDVVVEKSETSNSKSIQQLLDAAPKKSLFPKHLVPFTRQQRRSPSSTTSPIVSPPPRPCCSVQPIPIKPSKKKYKVAIIACGEFWSPQDRLKRVHGIKRVVVGYVGGQHPSPTFHDMKDHTQSLLVEYNPKKISYREILQLWNDNDDPWKEPEDDFDCVNGCVNGCDDTHGSPSPFISSYGIFYPQLMSSSQHDLCHFQQQQMAHQSKKKCVNSRSALFVLDQQQEEQAVEYVAELALTRPHDELEVDIVHVRPRSDFSSSNTASCIPGHNDINMKRVAATLPSLRFYKAEEYQQDYLKKQREMAREQLELWKMDLCPSGLHPILE